MITYMGKRCALLFLMFFQVVHLCAQHLLPPAQAWEGASESLIVPLSHPWVTVAEKTNFSKTATYDETMAWFKKLTATSALLSMQSIATSAEGRSIEMIIASSEKNKTASALNSSKKPLILVQAGIHAGEIDGKDAGMMFLRDLVLTDKKTLLDHVNLLFIPILNVDGHERASPFNRPNQRGPENMGWRTNAQNLNLNRDYTKLDTKEIRAVVKVINEYRPDVYIDIHVTDGVDYQYDITYGGYAVTSNSPEIGQWLQKICKPFVDLELQAKGHIPGPLLFAVNDKDFSEGNVLTMGAARFSDNYGTLRHMASILVENHSLKPFKQRVLGTYVFLEGMMRVVSLKGNELKKSTQSDQLLRPDPFPLTWDVPQFSKKDSSLIKAPDSLQLLGIASRNVFSSITNTEVVEWLGKPIRQNIADYKGTQPNHFIKRPKGYWIPSSCYDVIERLKLHGIKMEVAEKAQELTVEMYRMDQTVFGKEKKTVMPFEGHIMVTGAATHSEMRKEVYPKGSVYISTDQTLGDLAITLLEPASEDSYFSWGFFMSIFQRTEYIEAYVIEPMAKKMLEDSPELKTAFELKKQQEPSFANNPYEIRTWFYSKTPYYDQRYLLYPIGRAL